jgi:hypothetical protein
VSRVEFRLDTVADGTRLRVAESDLGAGLPETQLSATVAALGTGPGWARVLMRLAAVIPAAVATAG